MLHVFATALTCLYVFCYSGQEQQCRGCGCTIGALIVVGVYSNVSFQMEWSPTTITDPFYQSDIMLYQSGVWVRLGRLCDGYWEMYKCYCLNSANSQFYWCKVNPWTIHEVLFAVDVCKGIILSWK